MIKVYAIARGRKTGIFHNWDVALPHVHGFKNSMYKSFVSRKEAESWLTAHGGKKDESVCKHTKRPLPLLAPKAEPPAKKRTLSDTSRLIVYCDGSCLANGSPDARGGIGVWFGSGDPRNVSEPVVPPTDGRSVTNGLAELLAAIRALDVLPSDKPAEVHCDSTYVVKSALEYRHNWIAKGWNVPIMHKKEMQAFSDKLDDRIRRGVPATFVHVYAHCGNVGNEAADRLASTGAAAAVIRNPSPKDETN